MSVHNEIGLTLQDHERAFTEVSFVLEMLVRTAGEVVGKGTAPLGVSAGKHMAKKLPVLLSDPTLEKVLLELAKRMQAGFEIESACDGTGAEVKFGRCAVRAVCRERKLEVGGDLCKMFHYYFAGVGAQLLGRPVRSGAISAGETCRARLDVQAQ